jgi:hypothetical protein
LVGTHIDLRDDLASSKKSLDKLHVAPAPQKMSLSKRKASVAVAELFVTTKEGMSASHKIGADSYVECSALTETGILRLKEAAIDAALNGEGERYGGCKCPCSVM